MKKVIYTFIIILATLFTSCEKVLIPDNFTGELTDITVTANTSDAVITATFDYSGDKSDIIVSCDPYGKMDYIEWKDTRFEAKIINLQSNTTYSFWLQYFDGVSTVSTQKYTFKTE